MSPPAHGTVLLPGSLSMEEAAAAALGVQPAPAAVPPPLPPWVAADGLQEGYALLMGQGMLSELESLEDSKRLATHCAQQLEHMRVQHARLQVQHEQLKAEVQAEQALRRQAVALLQQIHQLSAGNSAVTPGEAGPLPPAPRLVLVKSEGGSKRKVSDSAPLQYKQKRSRKGKEQPSAPDLPASELVEVQRISGRAMSLDTELQVYRIRYKAQDCFLEADAIRLHGGDCNDYSLVRRVGGQGGCLHQCACCTHECF